MHYVCVYLATLSEWWGFILWLGVYLATWRGSIVWFFHLCTSIDNIYVTGSRKTGLFAQIVNL